MREKTLDFKDLEEFKNFLKKFFYNKKVEIYLFGSRAKNENSPFSDIDIGIISNEDISYEISELKYLIEESNFPYKIDIVYLNENSRLKKIVLKEGIRWI